MVRLLRHRRALLMTATFLCGLDPASAFAQEHHADSLLTVDKYLDLEQVAEPKLSPDGAQIVYTRRWVNKQLDRWDSALWIIGADGSRNRFLTKGTNAVWSPDGTRIAYLAGRIRRRCRSSFAT